MSPRKAFNWRAQKRKEEAASGATLLDEAIDGTRMLSPQTKRSYKEALRHWYDFAGSDQKNWTAGNANAFPDWLMRVKKLTDRSANRRLFALKTASRRAHELYGLKDFAAAAEAIPQDQYRKREALTRGQAEALFAACDRRTLRGLRDYALLAIGFGIGARREGIINLDVEDFVAERELIIKMKAKPGRKPHLHRVPLPKRAIKAIKAYLKADPHNTGPLLRKTYVKTGHDGEKAFATVKAGRMSAIHVNEACTRLGKIAGVKFHPHLMRHSLVSWLFEDGASTPEVMAITGHESMEALKRYITIFDEKRLATVERGLRGEEGDDE